MTNSLHKKLFLLLILLLPTQLGIHFWPDWASVFGIRVDYLSPTIYLTDILIVGILLSWFFSDRPPLSTLRPLLYAICLLGITSLLVAKFPQVSLYKLTKLIELSLLGFYIFKNSPLLALRYMLPIAVAYSCLLAWLQFLFGRTIGGPLWILGERAFTVNTPAVALVDIGGIDYLRPYATFPHPNVLAGFLLVAIILLLKGPAGRLTPWAVGLAVATLIITFSHSAWIVGVAILILLKLEWLKTHTKIFTQIALLGALVASLIMPVLTREVNTSTLAQELGRRIDLAQAAAGMVADYPLTGVGLGNFIVRLPEYGGTPQVSWWLQPVHNIFLLIFAEIGLIGLGLTVFLLFLSVKRAKMANIPLTAAILVVVATGMSDHYWLTLQQGQILATIVMGLFLSDTIDK